MSKLNYHYNKNLKALARNLRNNATPAENHIWYELLANKKFFGIRFYRQRAIDKYIVDIFSKDLNLIIEVDGCTHEHEEVAINDEIRENKLRELGYNILRFTDEEVLFSLHCVYDVLERWLEDNFPQYFYANE